MYRPILKKYFGTIIDYSRPGQTLLHMPDYQEAQQHLGAGRLSSSIQSLQRVKEILKLYGVNDKQNYVHVLQKMAKIHIGLGENKEAENVLREIEKERKDQQAMNNLMGHLVRTQSQQVVDQGQQWADQGPINKLYYGTALLLQGKLEQAQQNLGEDGKEMSLNNGGVVQWRAGRAKEASILFIKSIGVVEGRDILEKEQSILEKEGSNRQLENIGQLWLEHYLATGQDEELAGYWLKMGLNYFQQYAPEEIGYTLVSLARLHVAQKQSIKAEGLLRHSITLIDSHTASPLHQTQRLYALKNYGILLDLLRRPGEAEEQRQKMNGMEYQLVNRLLLPGLVL